MYWVKIKYQLLSNQVTSDLFYQNFTWKVVIDHYMFKSDSHILPPFQINSYTYTFHACRYTTLSLYISNFVFVKNIKSRYSKTTYQNESNKTTHDYILS